MSILCANSAADAAGHEIKPGITILSEPKLQPDTGKYTCLANFHGMLALITVTIKSQPAQEEAS